MHIDQLESPAAVVDLDKLSANIRRLQNYLDEHGIANRPHIKTHKIAEIAHMQVDAGAVGITCQKLGEAEVMAQAGIKDIFLPYNLLGPAKLERLMHLARRVRISVTGDSDVTVRGYADAAKGAGLTLPVLVEFDTGLGRCGVQTPQEAADLARLIARSSHLHFGGLMTYPSNEQTDGFVAETRRLLAGDGIPVETVSAGGSPVMWQAHTHKEVTEHRAGTYVYGDRAMIHSGVMSQEEVAFHVIATVVSRPTGERAVLDTGSKALSSDGARGATGFGLILEYPDAVIERLNEEHGWVSLSASARKPEIGERVTLIVNHCCVANNLFNEIVGHRNGQVEVVWPVSARGLLQ